MKIKETIFIIVGIWIILFILILPFLGYFLMVYKVYEWQHQAALDLLIFGGISFIFGALYIVAYNNNEIETRNREEKFKSQERLRRERRKNKI